MASALNGTSVVLTEEKTNEIIHRTKEFASLNGILMRTTKTPDHSEEINYAPFSLFPSLVPKRLFEHAVTMQKDFNILMHKVAHDHEFLSKCLENVIKVDSFTRELWDIYTTVRNEGFSQKICLGLFRNDLMMDTKNSLPNKEGGEDPSISSKLQLKQIEFNTIASSFGGLVGRLRNVHRYSLNLAGVKPSKEQLPNNDPAMGLSKGLVHAWELYGKESASVLFLVGNKERNRFDQLWIEERIFQINPNISVIYRTLLEIQERAQLTCRTDNTLVIDGREVAVIYMRAGYSPTDYPTKKEWQARLMIERSKAIKSPAVHYQLAGTKKIQQELARPGAVEKYISDKTAVDRIRSTFVGQHSLDMDEEGNKAVLLGINRPHDFVLKPQREGGGI